MLQRAIDAGVPFAWFTADEVYGQAKYLRRWLEERDVAYVMAIRRSDTFPVSGGEQRADALTAALPRPVLAAAVGRRRGARPPGVPLGPDRDRGRRAAGPRALAAGPPLPARPG